MSAVLQLLNLKSEFNLSQSCFDHMCSIVKSMLPKDEKLPQNFYRAKVMVNALGMRYQKIDACPNHCMLYFKDQENSRSCPSCEHPRFKAKTRGNGSMRSKEVSYKSLCYFSLTPRLQ